MPYLAKHNIKGIKGELYDMKEAKYGSLLDAFRDLNSVSDDEVITSKNEKLVREAKEFSLSFNGSELEAAKEALEEDDKDEEIEVIDVNANTLEHIKDNKEYVGQVIIQCNKCHANKFIDMTELIVDDIDPELYNVDDECPNCHVKGEGFALVGQVAKVEKQEPVTPEVEPAAAEESSEEEVSVDNDAAPVNGEASFENDHVEEPAEEEPQVEAEEEEKTAEDELDFIPDAEKDAMETETSEDEEELELSNLGDEFDSDDVRKDDTEDDDEEDDEEKVKDELEPVEEVKPVVKRKLRLPTREALEKVRTAKVTITEELMSRFVLPESIDKIIVTSGKTKIYEGIVEELPDEVNDAEIEGFDVANGYLMCNVDPVTDDVDMPLAKVLNCFTDDDTIKICVWDDDTSEELFQGSKAEALAKFGHCQLVSVDAPKTLRLNIKAEHSCNCVDGQCTCDTDEEEVSAEDSLLDNIFKSNDLAKYNVDDQRSEEF